MKSQALLAEFLGTFLLVGAILFTGSWFSIGMALGGIVWAIGGISGGHVNPAVSFIMYLKQGNTFEFNDFLSYTVVQVVGAFLALVLYRNLA
jgi:aquaporin Z